MPFPRVLVFIRHAESEGNLLDSEARTRLIKPTHAYELTPRGKEQAKAVGDFVKEVRPVFDLYTTSYYRRAIDTMSYIAPPDTPVKIDSRLRESERGIYHSYSRQERQQWFPLEDRRKELEGLYHYRPPGGENWPDVELRAQSFLDTMERSTFESVCVVCHGHWLILARRLLDGYSVEESVRRYHTEVAANASTTTYINGVFYGYLPSVPRKLEE